MRFAMVMCLLAALLSTLFGCATTIVPPPTVTDPVAVFVLDHGYSSSVVLPDEYGTVRYAYGDHSYYARGNRGVLQGAVALFWPTQAALGREQLSAEPVASDVRQRVGVRIEAIHEVPVARARARALVERLNGYFEARAEEMVVNPSAELRFVPVEPDYHIFYNSNHAVVQWLEALGAEVRGVPIASRWHIAEP